MTTPTVPTLEKVMTMAATIDPPQQVGDDLSIYNVPGGTILGDGFTAAIIAPSADWARPVSSSVIGLDVRLSAQTETGHYLYLTYTGRVVISDDVAQKRPAARKFTARKCISPPIRSLKPMIRRWPG